MYGVSDYNRSKNHRNQVLKPGCRISHFQTHPTIYIYMCVCVCVYNYSIYIYI